MVVVEAVDRICGRCGSGLSESRLRRVLCEREERQRQEHDTKQYKRHIPAWQNASLHVFYYIVPSIALVMQC